MLAGVKGFEPLIYSLGGCRLVLARLHAHYGFLRGKLVYQPFRRSVLKINEDSR